MKEENELKREQAMMLFDRAYRAQSNREWGEAIRLYRRSIEMHPTPEAYTFLGWTYSLLKRYDEAIEVCHKAIELDPEYGNPYNDIGVYLIEKEEWEEAIPWLEKAMVAPRYEPRHFPYLNMGRIHEKLGNVDEALSYYNRALQMEPLYLSAEWSKNRLLGKLN